MTTTLAMIVKNEAANLVDCLDSVRGLFSETIIVDTGSSDRTVAIARRYGARVLRFKWCDDFAAARNVGLEAVRTDYVFRFDADDRLEAGHKKRLARLLAGLGGDPVVWMFRVISKQHTGAFAISDEARLWPNHPQIRFRGRVHERIHPETIRGRGDLVGLAHGNSDCRIVHVGYETEAEFLAKLRRNAAILERMLDEPGVDPIVYFDIGRTVAGLGEYKPAVDMLETFLTKRDRRHTVAGRVAYRRLAELHLAAGDQRATAEAAQRGLREYQDDQVLVATLAGLMAAVGEVALAREGFERALELSRTQRTEFGVPVDFPERIARSLAALPATGTIRIRGGMVAAI